MKRVPVRALALPILALLLLPTCSSGSRDTFESGRRPKTRATGPFIITSCRNRSAVPEGLFDFFQLDCGHRLTWDPLGTLAQHVDGNGEVIDLRESGIRAMIEPAALTSYVNHTLDDGLAEYELAWDTRTSENPLTPMALRYRIEMQLVDEDGDFRADRLSGTAVLMTEDRSGTMTMAEWEFEAATTPVQLERR